MRDSEGRRGGFLLTGASGMVGQALAAELQRRGIRLVQALRVGTSPKQKMDGVSQVQWQTEAPEPFANTELLKGLDVAVHLSGANVAGRRWTSAYKREIVTSRTVTTETIARTVAGLRQPPRLLIAASAIGIYGDRGDEVLTDSSAAGNGFMSETCKAWEASTAPAVGIRVVHLRLGVVLDQHSGALAKVLPLFRVGLGGRLGSGKQWMSWIAIDDVVRAVLHIAGYGADASEFTGGAPLAGQLEGPVNCVSPVPVTNAEYTRALAGTLHRPAFAAAPAFALRLAVGEMADAALLASCRAMPEKLLASGFQFRFPEIGAALTHLLAR